MHKKALYTLWITRILKLAALLGHLINDVN